jgi:hypothetical protein
MTATSIKPFSGKPGSFAITTTEPERVWFIKAENEDEMQKWMNACIMHSKYSRELSNQPKYSNSNSNSSSSSSSSGDLLSILSKTAKKEGFLDKLHGGVSGKIASLRKQLQWRTRWFVLKDGILFKYESKEDKQPTKIPLYKCTLQEYKTENADELSNQFQILSKTKSIILRTANEEEMHEWLNAILKHKIMIEQIINDIEIS